MYKKIVMFCILLCMTLAVSGCLTIPGGIAPSTMPITANDSYTVVKEGASASGTSVSFLFIPIKIASSYSVLQAAKENNGADALINVTGTNRCLYFIIVNFQVMRIHGDAIKFERGGSVL